MLSEELNFWLYEQFLEGKFQEYERNVRIYWSQQHDPEKWEVLPWLETVYINSAAMFRF